MTRNAGLKAIRSCRKALTLDLQVPYLYRKTCQEMLALKVPRNAKTSRFDMTDKVLLRTDNVVIHCKCEGIMQKMEFQTLISPIHPKMLKTARLGL